MRCDRCGYESSVESVFQKVRRSFSTKIQVVCPHCLARTHVRAGLFSLYCFVFSAVAGILIAILDRQTTAGPLFLNLALLQVFLFLSTILHEIGHIVAARIAGLRVFGIEIGHGRTVADFRFGGLRWQFRAFPFGGFAHANSRTSDFYRLRQSFFILGGPAVNALLVFVSVAAFREQENFNGLITESLAPATMLFFANATLLVYSLVPHKGWTSYGELPNDGLLLWLTWKQSADEAKEQPIYWYYREAEEGRLQGSFSDAHRWIDDGLKIYPENFVLESERAAILLDEGRCRDGLRMYVILLARYKGFPEVFAALLNNVAYAAVLTGEPVLIETADFASGKALQLMPWVPHYKGTRGAVLLKLRRYDEALRLLNEAFALHKERRDLASCAWWIAEAYRGLGEEGQCERYRALSARIDPHCPVTRRLQRDALPSQALA